jgi:molybdate transport system ATP-binding protein
MSVRQNILCGLNREKDRGAKERRLRDMLRMMQLEGLEDRKPAQLSGGQQQRAALARILVNDPQILLLDEPFSALDGHLRDSLKVEMRDLLETFGREVLMVTHDRIEAYNMSRDIAVMDNGRLLTIKPTKALFADPGSVQAAILTGCKNIVKASRVDEHTVEIPEWGVRMETKDTVKEGLCAVGVRAHYFNPNAAQNRFPVRFIEEMEEPFETILHFRYESQREESPAIWWRLPKEKRPRNFPSELGVAAANILLLYE